MATRPKNFSQAIEDLGRFADEKGSDLKSKVQSELNNLEETIQKLKPHLEDLKNQAEQEAGKAKTKIEEQVTKNPWAAVGIVGLIAFIIGFLFASRGGRRD